MLFSFLLKAEALNFLQQTTEKEVHFVTHADNNWFHSFQGETFPG